MTTIDSARMWGDLVIGQREGFREHLTALQREDDEDCVQERNQRDGANPGRELCVVPLTSLRPHLIQSVRQVSTRHEHNCECFTIDQVRYKNVRFWTRR